MSQEHRKSNRRRLLKAGIIVANNGYVTYRCTVRDLSDTGARIIVDDPKGIPDSFDLIIELDGLRAECEVVRRKGCEFGVRFIGKPRREAPRRSQVVMSSNAPKASLRRKI